MIETNTMNKTKIFVYPWNKKSQGAKALSAALGISRIKTEDSSFQGGEGKTVINWGSSELPDSVKACRVINDPRFVKLASDKLKFFTKMSSAIGPRLPKFTNIVSEALEWVKKGETVLARTKLQASGGSGIVFIEDINAFLEAKLYTVYKKKKEEYRVHMIFGNPECIQKKILRKHDDTGREIDPKAVDFRIRNLRNGFIFQRHDIHPPEDVLVQAQKAIVTSGLDFGAVDVIWNEAEGKAYVLEINTAPGLEGTTVSDYAKAFAGGLS